MAAVMSDPAELLTHAKATRNDALEFAARTLKNLAFITAAREQGQDVHEVTHLANSLLGLVVFPFERHFVRFILKQKLSELPPKEWPQWRFDLQVSDSLGDLVYHLRNAVAHGRIEFSSDSRRASDVRIIVEDARPGGGPVYWRASLAATDLKLFCTSYVKLLEDVIG